MIYRDIFTLLRVLKSNHYYSKITFSFNGKNLVIVAVHKHQKCHYVWNCYQKKIFSMHDLCYYDHFPLSLGFAESLRIMHATLQINVCTRVYIFNIGSIQHAKLLSRKTKMSVSKAQNRGVLEKEGCKRWIYHTDTWQHQVMFNQYNNEPLMTRI